MLVFMTATFIHLLLNPALGFWHFLWNVEKLTTKFDHFRTVRVGKQAVVADTMETVRQHMQQEATYGLTCR